MLNYLSALNLSAAEATGADINMLRLTVYNSLDALHIGLPCTVGASVGVRNFDSKGNVLVTELALCHG